MGTRMKLVLAALVAVSLVGTLGCTGGRRRGGGGGGGGTDSGTTPPADSGTPGTDSGTPGTDSGVPRDSGTTTPRDSGGTIPECTTSGDCLSSEECSDGMCVAVTCPTNTVSTITTQYCSDDTQACVEGCSDGTCILSCLESDASPDCMTCANINIIACINRNGCQEEWNCFNACVEDNCPEGSASTCVDTYCSTENDAYNDCSDTVPDSAGCGTEWTPCVGL